jgi:hypothetical protein
VVAAFRAVAAAVVVASQAVAVSLAALVEAVVSPVEEAVPVVVVAEDANRFDDWTIFTFDIKHLTLLQ